MVDRLLWWTNWDQRGPIEGSKSRRTKHYGRWDLVLQSNQNDPFLKGLTNIQRRRSWWKTDEPSRTTSRADIHQKKITLSVWWDYNGIVYFDLFLSNKTIDSYVYCQELTRLNDTLQQESLELLNWTGILFHQDNFFGHSARITAT